MATREDVYLAFGRAAELAQLLELQLGNILLCHDAIERRAYIQLDPEGSRRALDAIDNRTLGASLRAIGARFKLGGDAPEMLEKALAARNFLTHRFFSFHAMTISTEAGCDKMIAHIEDLRSDMWPAYQSAQVVSGALMKSFQELKRAHDEDPCGSSTE